MHISNTSYIYTLHHSMLIQPSVGCIVLRLWSDTYLTMQKNQIHMYKIFPVETGSLSSQLVISILSDVSHPGECLVS